MGEEEERRREERRRAEEERRRAEEERRRAEEERHRAEEEKRRIKEERRRKEEQKLREDRNPLWIEMFTPQRRPYFVNFQNPKQKQWVRPKELYQLPRNPIWNQKFAT